MTNRILDLVVLNHRLDPVVTELRVHVKVESLTPTTQILGNMIGPQCKYANTIEIPYALREIARGDDQVELRVTIPEPAWWDPQSPFLYRGLVQLWQDKELCKPRVELFH